MRKYYELIDLIVGGKVVEYAVKWLVPELTRETKANILRADACDLEVDTTRKVKAMRQEADRLHPLPDMREDGG